MSKLYSVNEIFLSCQGEGVRAGTVNLFLRFAGCNLTCNVAEHGFDCDTEFVSGRKMAAEEIVAELRATGGDCRWVICTGGEPALQLDAALMFAVHDAGYKVAIETNGTRDVSALGLDWITCSPKVAEHAIKCLSANEVKYVRGHGQALPKTVVNAEHQLISPAFDGDQLDRRSLAWCIELVKRNPTWRLSVQQHKTWLVR